MESAGIEVPSTFRVRYAETDSMGIAHHSSYVIWMEMGRTEYSRATGFTYRQLEESGVLLPVIEIGVRYRASAQYDDELRIVTTVDEVTRTRLRFGYRIERTDNGKLLAEGFSLHTYAGPDGRVIRITHHPAAWARLLQMAGRSADDVSP